MDKTVNNLLLNPHIFRFRDVPENGYRETSVSTGYSKLDKRLWSSGWPRGGITEILVDCYGSGELQLVIPALAKMSHEGDWITWVSPPYTPYPPALLHAGLNLSRLLLVRTRRSDDALWAAEQSLRSGSSAATLLWIENVQDKSMRRLQLAAEEGNSMGLIFRPMTALAQASPAALRIKLFPDHTGIHLHIVKMRGGKPFNLRLSKRILSPEENS